MRGVGRAVCAAHGGRLAIEAKDGELAAVRGLMDKTRAELAGAWLAVGTAHAEAQEAQEAAEALRQAEMRRMRRGRPWAAGRGSGRRGGGSEGRKGADRRKPSGAAAIDPSQGDPSGPHSSSEMPRATPPRQTEPHNSPRGFLSPRGLFYAQQIAALRQTASLTYINTPDEARGRWARLRAAWRGE